MEVKTSGLTELGEEQGCSSEWEIKGSETVWQVFAPLVELLLELCKSEKEAIRQTGKTKSNQLHTDLFNSHLCDPTPSYQFKSNTQQRQTKRIPLCCDPVTVFTTF